jgi:RNA 2',3'-cyclic 3'-phosphodiesterase
MRRLFFALWPSVAIRNALDRMADSIAAAHGRRTRRNNLHLTLEFLGSQGDAEMRKAIQAVSLLELPAFDFALNALEYFSRSRVLVLTCGDRTSPVFELHSALHEALSSVGFTLEQRPFRPHLTLFRECQPVSTVSAPTIIWPVRSLALVESRSMRSGVRYQVRWRKPLSTQPHPG